MSYAAHSLIPIAERLASETSEDQIKALTSELRRSVKMVDKLVLSMTKQISYGKWHVQKDDIFPCYAEE